METHNPCLLLIYELIGITADTLITKLGPGQPPCFHSKARLRTNAISFGERVITLAVLKRSLWGMSMKSHKPVRNRVMLVAELVIGTFMIFGISMILRGGQSPPSTATASAPKDAQALALIQKTLSVLNGPVGAVNDVVLSGTATRTAGSDVQQGQITLRALGTTQSRVDFQSGSGTSSDVRNIDQRNVPHGFGVSADGSTHKQAGHNTLTDAVWFLPSLSFLSKASRPTTAISYIGQESRRGISVQHIRLALQNPNPKVPAIVNTHVGWLSQTDFYLDTGSSFPVSVTFNIHPDENGLVAIPVEIDFSDYRAIDGIQIPFRIKKLVNGTMFDDIIVQTAQVNTGLTAPVFAAQ
jgi:hypothetical protein